MYSPDTRNIQDKRELINYSTGPATTAGTLSPDRRT